MNSNDFDRQFDEAKANTKAWAVAKPWVAMACAFAAGFFAGAFVF